jgi:uncharacterized protein
MPTKKQSYSMRTTTKYKPTNIPLDYAGSPLETVFFQALSALFPSGESYFNRSLLAYQKDLPFLEPMIREFTRQEAQHSVMHHALNGDSKAIAAIDKRLDKTLKLATKLLPRAVNLQATIILESITADLANVLVGDLVIEFRMNPEAYKAWLVHALDEQAHEYVAIDVAIAAGANKTLLRKLLTPLVYVLLITHIVRNNVVLAKERGSLRGTIGWGILVYKFLNGIDWHKPFDGSYYPIKR